MNRQKNCSANEDAGPPGGQAKGRHDGLLGFFLVVITILAYQPVWYAGFIWDDDGHITPPELRSLNGLARIWIQLGATQQYYPLVHSVFWVEHKLWGDAPLGYHLLNVLLHVFSALLLVKILRQLQIPGAWLAAALFALHPVEVESVAWITELKNTLSGVFYLSAALAYLGFDQNRNRGKYAMALGLFLLGLMSKTVIASLPAALLVIFWWQRGKLSWKRDVLPLIPFFIVGIGAGLFTAWVERKFIHAEGAEFDFSLVERCLIAGRAIWFYLGKLIWPVDLIFMNPRWDISQAVWWQYLFPGAVLLLLGVLVWRRWRGPLAGLLFFIGTLFPALGFFNVYPFRYSFVADHFQYLASLGPIVLAAAGITALPGFFRKRKPFLEPVLCATLLLTLAALTWRQCGIYANVKTLWQSTLRLNPGCWLAHNNLGLVLFYQEGQPDEAIAHFQKALELKPDYTFAHYNLGNVLGQQGRVDEAIAQYQKALAIQPDFAAAHLNLGNILGQQGRADEAIAHFQKALAIQPDYAEAHYNLGNSLDQQGRADEAIAQYQKALAIRPDYAEARYNLGGSYFRLGRINEAVAQYQKALELKPGNAEAHNNLGLCFSMLDRTEEAITQYQMALKIQPDYAVTQKNLAWALATCPQASLRDGRKAVALAQRANQLTGGGNVDILCTLAAACAEAGLFPEAVKTARSALRVAGEQSNAALAAQLQAQLKLYQAGVPFHGPAQTH